MNDIDHLNETVESLQNQVTSLGSELYDFKTACTDCILHQSCLGGRLADGHLTNQGRMIAHRNAITALNEGVVDQNSAIDRLTDRTDGLYTVTNTQHRLGADLADKVGRLHGELAQHQASTMGGWHDQAAENQVLREKIARLEERLASVDEALSTHIRRENF